MKLLPAHTPETFQEKHCELSVLDTDTLRLGAGLPRKRMGQIFEGNPFEDEDFLHAVKGFDSETQQIILLAIQGARKAYSAAIKNIARTESLLRSWVKNNKNIAETARGTWYGEVEEHFGMPDRTGMLAWAASHQEESAIRRHTELGTFNCYDWQPGDVASARNEIQKGFVCTEFAVGEQGSREARMLRAGLFAPRGGFIGVEKCIIQKKAGNEPPNAIYRSVGEQIQLGIAAGVPFDLRYRKGIFGVHQNPDGGMVLGVRDHCYDTSLSVEDPEVKAPVTGRLTGLDLHTGKKVKPKPAKSGRKRGERRGC
jgi:hypothetical protein